MNKDIYSIPFFNTVLDPQVINEKEQVHSSEKQLDVSMINPPRLQTRESKRISRYVLKKSVPVDKFQKDKECIETNRCLGITFEGHQCKVKQYPFCSKHKQCMNQIVGYHQTCDLIWDLSHDKNKKSIISEMSDKQLVEKKKIVYECLKGRIKYAHDCCRGDCDNGHYTVIKKIKKLLDIFNNEIERRGI